MTIERTLCPILVGREEELSDLEDALLGAARGHGRVAVLSGEAGLGKTRLATELRRRAALIGCLVLWGSCSEADLGLPYQPFVEAAAKHLAQADLDDVRVRIGTAAEALAALFPQLGPAPPTPLMSDPGAKVRLFEGFLTLLRVFAADRPLLLVLEDLHWADASTRDLLDHVTRRIEQFPILVLVTYRREETPRRHPISATIQGWRRSRLAEMVELRGLTSNEIGVMVSAIFEEEAVSSAFRDYLHARTAGNPFVVEEMLKEAIASGDVFPTATGWDRRSIDDLRLPPAVSDAILTRVERLSPEQVSLLQTAAVLGREFSSSALMALTALPGEALDTALRACVAEQFLDIEPEAGGHFRFRHSLTHEVVYDDLLPSQREELHRRAAEFLQASGAPDADIGRHLGLAGQPRKAVPFYLRAAYKALATNAPADAVEFYRRALPHVEDREDRGRILSLLGEALWRSGDVRNAEPPLTEAVTLLEETANDAAVAHARLLRGRCAWESGRVAESHREYDIARRILEPLGPSEDLALTYLRLAHLQCTEWRFEAALETAERVIDVATAASCDWLRIWGHTYRGMAMCQLGDVEAGIRTIDRSAREASAYGFHWIARNACINGANQRMYALRKGEIPGELARMRSMPGVTDNDEVWSLGFEWAYNFARGDLTSAMTCINAVEVLSRRTGQGSAAVNVPMARAWTLLERDEIDEAARIVLTPEQWENSEDRRDVRWALIGLRLEQGRVDAAAELARDVMTPEGCVVAPWLSEIAVEALVAGGHLQDAMHILHAPDQFGEPGRAPYRARAVGRIAFGAGDVGEARRNLEAAAEMFHACDETVEELRTRLVLSRALAASGEVDRATGVIHDVLSVAEPRELARLARHGRELAVKLGVRLRAPQTPPAADASAPGEVVQPDVEATERLVTTMFADIRGYTVLTANLTPVELADRVSALQRWALREVGRHGGVVDKFAGDAVMATFNVSGRGLDHCGEALEAALALRDKGSLLGLPLGIGIAVGPAVVGRLAPGGNLSVLGDATNLASRLQTEATAGEIVLSAEAYRRVHGRLREHRIEARSDERLLKGFEDPVPIFRVPARDAAGTPPIVVRPSDAVEHRSQGGNVFRQEGEFWTLGYAGNVVRLKDSKGLHDLARLLATPGRAVAAADLVAERLGPLARRPADMTGPGFGLEGDAGPLLDAQARHQYRARLTELDEELAEAEASNDPERSYRARAEREFLLAELRAAVGLGGRPRVAASPLERARKAAAGRIREAIMRIRSVHPTLARHLSASVRTGTLCVYEPPEATVWEVSAGIVQARR